MTASSGSFKNVITNYGGAIWSAQVFITAQSGDRSGCFERIRRLIVTNPSKLARSESNFVGSLIRYGGALNS